MNISEKTCKSNHEREHVRQGMLPFVINNVYKDIDIHEQQQTGNIHIIIVMISGTESFLPYGWPMFFLLSQFPNFSFTSTKISVFDCKFTDFKLIMQIFSSTFTSTKPLLILYFTSTYPLLVFALPQKLGS